MPRRRKTRVAPRRQRPLTPRERRFVAEYLIDRAAGAAYRRAGYRPKNDHTANTCAYRLLGRPDVQAAVARGEAERAERTAVTADRVLQELALVAFSDVGQVLDFSGAEPRLRPANEIPEAARRAVSSVKVRRERQGRGPAAPEVEVTEFKLWDKLAALAKLAAHLGLAKEPGTADTNVSVKVNTGPRLDLSKLTDEQLEQLDAIYAAANDDAGADRTGAVPPPP
jgi:phage terminase small subunit